MKISPFNVSAITKGRVSVNSLNAKVCSQFWQEILESVLNILLESRPVIGNCFLKNWAIILIQVKNEVIFCTHDVNGESVKTIVEGFVSEFMLPFSPLIVEDIVKRGYSVSLLPLSQKVNVSEWWIQSVKMSLSTNNILSIECGLDP